MFSEGIAGILPFAGVGWIVGVAVLGAGEVTAGDGVPAGVGLGMAVSIAVNPILVDADVPGLAGCVKTGEEGSAWLRRHVSGAVNQRAF